MPTGRVRGIRMIDARQSDTIAAHERPRAGSYLCRTSSYVKEIRDMVAAGRAGGRQHAEFLRPPGRRRSD